MQVLTVSCFLECFLGRVVEYTTCTSFAVVVIVGGGGCGGGGVGSQ